MTLLKLSLIQPMISMLIFYLFSENVLFLNTFLNEEAKLVSHMLTSTTHEPCLFIRLYAHQTSGTVTIKSNTDGKEDIIKNITLEKGHEIRHLLVSLFN
jgi:hypothetical protein